LAVFLLIKVPQWQAARWEGRIEAKEVAKQESDTRTTVVQAIGGAVLFMGGENEKCTQVVSGSNSLIYLLL
jgi:hypothetical protein